MGVRIDSLSRPLIKERRIFDDGYVWETDYENNHRLYHTLTDNTTQWLKERDVAILNDRMIFHEVWRGFDVSVKQLLIWQRVAPPSQIINHDIQG